MHLAALAASADPGTGSAAELAADADQPAEPRTAYLSAWETSEHAVYYAAVENAIAQAVTLGGGRAADLVVTEACSLLRSWADEGCTEAGNLDMVAMCQCTGRCVHALCSDTTGHPSRGLTLLQHLLSNIMSYAQRWQPARNGQGATAGFAEAGACLPFTVADSACFAHNGQAGYMLFTMTELAPYIFLTHPWLASSRLWMLRRCRALQWQRS
jgi:hypothetical protein